MMLEASVIEALKGVPAAPEVEFDIPKEVETFTNQKAQKPVKPKAPAKAKTPKAPKPAKEPKAPRVTKQAKANEIVAMLFAGKTFSQTKDAKDRKAEAILAIMTEVGMTKAGATTYFYNALKGL